MAGSMNPLVYYLYQFAIGLLKIGSIYHFEVVKISTIIRAENCLVKLAKQLWEESS